MIFQSTSSIQRKTMDGALDMDTVEFQSTSSIQRKTGSPSSDLLHLSFQSTSSIQRKTGRISRKSSLFRISIHFLYTEEDKEKTPYRTAEGISIHFLYTEEDCKTWLCVAMVYNFNPLPLYRGRRYFFSDWKFSIIISIHFLYTEEDTGRHERRYRDSGTFQSTSSIQRKTSRDDSKSFMIIISIHFLYTEEDSMDEIFRIIDRHFNPLPLYRGRRQTKQF